MYVVDLAPMLCRFPNASIPSKHPRLPLPSKAPTSFHGCAKFLRLLRSFRIGKPYDTLRSIAPTRNHGETRRHRSKHGTPSDSIAHDSSPFESERANEPSTPQAWTSPFIRASIGGLALFSDGYNAQVVGYMNPVLTSLYPDSYTSSMKTRMSNAFLIGEVFGMLFFGWAINRLGRRQGIIWATVFLVLGIVLMTATSSETDEGRFWMMVVGRGVAGFGAGGWLMVACLFLIRCAD